MKIILKTKINIFLVKIESSDEKRFYSSVVNYHEIGPANKIKISKKLRKIKSIRLWGFLSSEKNKTIWKNITENDWFLFNVKNRYLYAARVIDKSSLKELSGFIEQPKRPIEKLELFVLFKDLHEISKGTERTNHEFGIKTQNNPNWKFLQVPTNYVNDLIKNNQNLENFFGITQAIKKKMEKTPLILPASLKKIPRKIQCTIIRHIRDTDRARNLKMVYQNKCQLCEFAFPESSEGYSEVHHVWPLAENGDDDYDNMLVLCPNHHAEFDYGVIRFNIENTTIIVDSASKLVGKLSFIGTHQLAEKNVKYHNNIRARKANGS